MAYERGTGPEALPYGAATNANENQPAPQDDIGALALENTDIPVQFAPGEDDPIPDDDGGPDNLQILLGHPDPNYRPSPFGGRRPGRIPHYTVRQIAQFRAAATAPDAPPGLRALYKATLRQLEEERRQGI